MTLGSLFGAFLRRDWAIARSYRANFGLELVEGLVSIVLFFYLSRIVDQTELNSSSHLEGTYFAFVILGLVFMRLMQAALTSFATQLNADQRTGTLEALLVTPAPQTLIVLGSATYELLLGALSGIVMLAVATIFFGLDLSLAPWSVPVLVVTIPASYGLFTAVGVAIAAFTVVFKQVTTLVTFAATGIALAAGVYFPLDVFPPGLEQLAKALPFSWALDLFRASLLGGDPSLGKLAALVGVSAVALPCAFRVFELAVARAKRSGTISHY